MNYWVVLYRSGCDWCDKAKDLLERKGEEYFAYDLNSHSQIKSFVKSCGLSTVPQVYLNGKLIGGYDDLRLFFLNTDGSL